MTKQRRYQWSKIEYHALNELMIYPLVFKKIAGGSKLKIINTK